MSSAASADRSESATVSQSARAVPANPATANPATPSAAHARATQRPRYRPADPARCSTFVGICFLLAFPPGGERPPPTACPNLPAQQPRRWGPGVRPRAIPTVLLLPGHQEARCHAGCQTEGRCRDHKAVPGRHGAESQHGELSLRQAVERVLRGPPHEVKRTQNHRLAVQCFSSPGRRTASVQALEKRHPSCAPHAS